jgi:hypothetical protein
MFPLEHLNAFTREGIVSTAAPVHAGFSGWIPRPSSLLTTSVPQVIERFKQDGVDVALLTGG